MKKKMKLKFSRPRAITVYHKALCAIAWWLLMCSKFACAPSSCRTWQIEQLGRILKSK